MVNSVSEGLGDTVGKGSNNGGAPSFWSGSSMRWAEIINRGETCSGKQAKHLGNARGELWGKMKGMVKQMPCTLSEIWAIPAYLALSPQCSQSLCHLCKIAWSFQMFSKNGENSFLPLLIFRQPLEGAHKLKVFVSFCVTILTVTGKWSDAWIFD